MPNILIPFAITSAFAGVFVYSAWHEFARRRREGPLENPRDAFDFDEDAPSFEAPDDTTSENCRRDGGNIETGQSRQDLCA